MQRRWKQPHSNVVYLFILASGLAYLLLRYGIGAPWAESWKSIERIEFVRSRKLTIADRVVLLRKTGHSVAVERLPIHIIEQRKDIPHKLFYSDANLQIGDTNVIDILANASSNIRAQKAFHGYFALHRSIKDQMPAHAGEEAWELDKYKNIPLLGHAYRTFPNKDFYVVIDADTYLFWESLLLWLSMFDPREQIYMGYPNRFPDTTSPSGLRNFAHGGSGYVVSRGVMNATYATDPWGWEKKWDSVLDKVRWGDVAFAQSLYATPEIEFTEGPSIGQDHFHDKPPRDLQFGAWNWLSPIFTLHQLKPAEVHQLRQFELQVMQTFHEPDFIRHCDIFHHYAPAFLQTALELYENSVVDSHEVDLVRSHWDASAGGQLYYTPAFATQKGVPYDATFCQELCDGNQECFSWTFEEGKNRDAKCIVNRASFRYGSPSKIHTSGWRLDRINRFMEEQKCSDTTARYTADKARFKHFDKILRH